MNELGDRCFYGGRELRGHIVERRARCVIARRHDVLPDTALALAITTGPHRDIHKIILRGGKSVKRLVRITVGLIVAHHVI